MKEADIGMRESSPDLGDSRDARIQDLEAQLRRLNALRETEKKDLRRLLLDTQEAAKARIAELDATIQGLQEEREVMARSFSDMQMKIEGLERLRLESALELQTLRLELDQMEGCLDRLGAVLEDTRKKLERSNELLKSHELELLGVYGSRSWRLTGFLRALNRFLSPRRWIKKQS